MSDGENEFHCQRLGQSLGKPIVKPLRTVRYPIHLPQQLQSLLGIVLIATGAKMILTA